MGLKKDITYFAITTLAAALIARLVSREISYRVRQQTVRDVKWENQRNRESIIEFLNGRNLYDEVRAIRDSWQEVSGSTSEANDYDNGTSE